MKVDVAALVSDNLDLWTSAIERKSGAGRGGGKKVSLYGVERLRSLILDLAVRGKLVRQDSADAPATDLIKSVKADQARLMRTKAIGRGKAFPAVSDEPPFVIPENWTWVQLADVGHDWGQAEPQSDFTYIDVGSVDQGSGVVRSPTVLSPSAAPSRARKIVRRGTVIYSTVRPYLLNIAMIDRDFDPQPIASTAFAVVHPFDGIDPGYVFHYLRSPAFVRYVESCQTGIAYPAINDRQFFAAWFPLPPAAEQQRIVAKVDELMTLCDALGTQSTTAMEAHQTLVETLLGTLVSAVDRADLAREWQRLETHFDTLFTTDESIKALEQTVLELAVRGKLVAPEAADEPATELLKSIKAERATMERSKAIGKGKAFPNVSAEPPFAVPESWVWVQISDVGHDWGQAEPQTNFTYIDVGSIDQGLGILRAPNVLSARDAPSRARKIVRQGTVIYSTVRPYLLNIAIIDQDFDPKPVASTAFAIVHPFAGVEPGYVYRYLRSPSFVKYVESCQIGSTYPAINDRQFFAAWFPLPPHAEQQRIVARVDELMALCAALKARLADAEQISKHLADTIVERTAA